MPFRVASKSVLIVARPVAKCCHLGSSRSSVAAAGMGPGEPRPNRFEPAAMNDFDIAPHPLSERTQHLKLWIRGAIIPRIVPRLQCPVEWYGQSR